MATIDRRRPYGTVMDRWEADTVKATYRDAVLEIRLPKVEEVRPKEIKINLA